MALYRHRWRFGLTPASQSRGALRIGGAVTAVVGMVTGLCVIGAPVANANASNARVSDPASYVNPIIGTGSGGSVVGQLDMFPGATAPFGMLTLSPDTSPTGADGGGYYYDDSSIDGFALTHVSGPGCGAYGDFPILPTSGSVPSNPYTTTDDFSHTGEEASPGYYAVTLGSPQIRAQMTATTRTGLADFRYPAHRKADVLFKVDDSQTGDTNQKVRVVGDREVEGTVTSGHFCGSAGTYPVYFAARFNRPFSSFGTWKQSLQGANVLGSPDTGTLAWNGPNNNQCSTNTGSLTSVDGGQGEQWKASCVSGSTWVQVPPQGLVSGDAYTASVTLEANGTDQTAPVYLDFYDGCVDTTSKTVSLTPGKPVTLTDTATVGCSNSPQFQVRTAGSGSVDLTATDASIRKSVEKPSPGTRSASGGGTAAYASFGTSQSRNVQMQVAVSYVSQADAWSNLAAEQGSDPSFNSIREHTRADWNSLLGRVAVSGGSQADLEEFYTAVYHSLLDPSVFSDANGNYLGFDGKIHRVSKSQGAQYANYSGWDVYRSEIPLLSMLDPKAAGEMMQSLVNDGKQGGWLPKWGLADDYTDVMNGDSADAMIADAYAFGVRNFNVKEALKEMVKGASEVPTTSELGQGWYEERPQLASYLELGYTPNVEETSISPVDNGASQTLEYSLDDFGISEMAAGLGEHALETEYAARAHNWERLFNPSTGYLQPRDGSGDFPSGDPLTVGMGSFGQSGFQEGNAAQYDWATPQDMSALVQLIGGKAATTKRLNAFFTQLNVGPNQPNYWAGNEIDLNAPWAYDYVGSPSQTEALVRKITSTLYSVYPGGEPGNDDLGAMSSWLVWADLGIYPETAGAPVLVLGSPLFKQATVHLGTGKTLDISAPSAAANRPYVTQLEVNEKRTQKLWLSMTSVLAKGANLGFSLSAKADPKWGTSDSDAPPSWRSGQIPGTVAPAASVTVAPASSSSATLDFANATGHAIKVAWSLSSASGSDLSISPSSGTTTVPPGGTSTNVSVSASSSATDGSQVVALTATDGSTSLPTENLEVTIQPAAS